MPNVCSIKDFKDIVSISIENYATDVLIKELYDLLTRTDEHCDCISKEDIRERISELTDKINRKG